MWRTEVTRPLLPRTPSLLTSSHRREERSPIVLENILAELASSLDLPGERHGSGLPGHQHSHPPLVLHLADGMGAKKKASDLDMLIAPSNGYQDIREQIEVSKQLLDDAPAAKIPSDNILVHFALLKEYLFLLPQPLFPYNVSAAILEEYRKFCAQGSKEEEEGERVFPIQTFYVIVETMPKSHYVTARRLLRYLSKIAFLPVKEQSEAGEAAEQVKARAQQRVRWWLAVSLGPCMLRSSDDVLTVTMEAPVCCSIVNEFLLHAEDLFP
mmetsp:Transcript_34343/g.107662  ORF Transcript_34343/g.107662 Transcript_34343/m.107662 type:complete len:269 (-) Transcript_34343:129-935(-)